MSEDTKSTFERHFQTVIQAIIIILVGWFGNRTMETSDIVIRMEERQDALIRVMAEMKKDDSHSVSIKDFTNQETMFNIRIDALVRDVEATRKQSEKRILNQWQVIRELENKVEHYHANGRFNPDQIDGVYNYGDSENGN